MRIYMDTSALAKLIVAENESLSLLRCEQAEVGEDLRRPCAGRSVGDPEEPLPTLRPATSPHNANLV